MQKTRIYYHDQISSKSINLDLPTIHYLKNVLRLKLKDIIYVFNNTNTEYKATITELSKKSAVLEIIEKKIINMESELKINLGQVIGKGSKMDLIIQKTTELGINQISPLLSSRSIMKLNTSNTENKLLTWKNIAIAACCQCGRNILPIIHPPQDIKEFIKKVNIQSINLLLDPKSTITLNHPQITYLIKQNNNQLQINILIGPEGGLDQDEIEFAKKHNFIGVNLGPRILRTETAAIAITATLQLIFGLNL